MLMASYLKRMGLESSEADQAEESTRFWPHSWIKQQTVHRSAGRSGSESKAFATITMLNSCMSDSDSNEQNFINLKGIVATAAYNWKEYLFAEETINLFKGEVLQTLEDKGMKKFLKGDYAKKLEAQYVHSKQLAEQPKGFLEKLFG